MRRTADGSGPAGAQPVARPGISLLPLLTGLALMLLMTALPAVATDNQGQADHPAALLVFWAMSAGFVRGVGFIPRNIAARLFLSGLACAFALLLAITRLAWIARLPWLH